MLGHGTRSTILQAMKQHTTNVEESSGHPTLGARHNTRMPPAPGERPCAAVAEGRRRSGVYQPGALAGCGQQQAARTPQGSGGPAPRSAAALGSPAGPTCRPRSRGRGPGTPARGASRASPGTGPSGAACSSPPRPRHARARGRSAASAASRSRRAAGWGLLHLRGREGEGAARGASWERGRTWEGGQRPSVHGAAASWAASRRVRKTGTACALWASAQRRQPCAHPVWRACPWRACSPGMPCPESSALACRTSATNLAWAAGSSSWLAGRGASPGTARPSRPAAPGRTAQSAGGARVLLRWSRGGARGLRQAPGARSACSAQAARCAVSPPAGLSPARTCHISHWVAPIPRQHGTRQRGELECTRCQAGTCAGAPRGTSGRGSGPPAQSRGNPNQVYRSAGMRTKCAQPPARAHTRARALDALGANGRIGRVLWQGARGDMA
jgi:hypothetical protein